MGIYIKGMQMPSGCTDCSFSYQSMYCKAMPSHFCGSPEWEVDGVKPDWCPLTEVKEPHGRIVDADAIIQQAQKYEDEGNTFCLDSAEELEFYLDDEAPTIIERSKDDKI